MKAMGRREATVLCCIEWHVSCLQRLVGGAGRRIHGMIVNARKIEFVFEWDILFLVACFF